MPRPKKIKSVETKLPFLVGLTYLNVLSEGEFATVAEGLTAFGPKTIKNRVTVQVTKNGRTFSKVFFAPYARRIFFNPNTLAIVARNIERALP